MPGQPRPIMQVGDVRQAALGRTAVELPASPRTYDGGKAVIVAVYPVGHPQNKLGQTLVDVQPLADLPVFYRVPLATMHAHQDTSPALASSARRQPFDPRPRNTVEGISRDVRPGTYVWLAFAGGSLHDPVAVAGMRFRQDQDRPGATAERMDRVDRAGHPVPFAPSPLDSTMDEYPRALDVYNGVRVLYDNRGNLLISTSCDRAPVFPGHNGIPASPTPEGNAVFSTRGAAVGNQLFVSGAHPTTGEQSVGRHGRLSRDASDGTIRDETRSKIGHMIRRLRSDKGRLWESTKGSGDGSCYRENADGDYERLQGGEAELHGDKKAILDAPDVYLGSKNAGGYAVTFDELVDAVGLVLELVDQHTHTGVETGEGTSGAPIIPVKPIWSGVSEQFKAQNVRLDTSNSPSPKRLGDPDGD